MLKEWIRKIIFKRVRNSPANRLNVCVVSLPRCGVSAVGVVLSDIHTGIYGIPIDWHGYREIPDVILACHVKGWHVVYNVNPYTVDEFYDKILVIQRKKEILYEVQKEYAEATATVVGYNIHNIELYRYSQTYDFLYSQIYDHSFEEDRYFLLHLEHFNKYTEKTIESLCEWLEFDMHTYKKHVVIIPVKLVDRVDRDWDVNSCKITASHGICKTLKQIERMHDTKRNRSLG